MYSSPSWICHSIGNILHSPRYKTLSLFSTVYGIGPHTARQLYAVGLSTLKQLERYYDVEGAWDSEEDDSGVDDEDMAEVSTSHDGKSGPSKSGRYPKEDALDSAADYGRTSLPSPPPSDVGHGHVEEELNVKPEVSSQTFLDRTGRAESQSTKSRLELKGPTKMIDEEATAVMPKKEIEESWIKIALGLREDLIVK